MINWRLLGSSVCGVGFCRASRSNIPNLGGPAPIQRSPYSLRSLWLFVFALRKQAFSGQKQKAPSTMWTGLHCIGAEGVGFEPTIPVRVCRFSRPVHSTRLCHPSLLKITNPRGSRRFSNRFADIHRLAECSAFERWPRPHIQRSLQITSRFDSGQRRTCQKVV